LSDERGLASVVLLALLPALLAAGAVIATGLLLMKNDGEAKHACRTELLASQETAAHALNQLLALNPAAAALRAERQAAEAAVLAAPPHLKAAAVAALDAVKAEQAILGAQQRRLFSLGQHSSREGVRAARMHLEKLFIEAHNRQGDLRFSLDFRANARPGRFALAIAPADSPTPNYDAPPGFSLNQTSSIDWNFHLRALLPVWTQSLVSHFDQRFQSHCSATIEKGQKEWIAVLKTDKH
jgi:hypothetical protein